MAINKGKESGGEIISLVGMDVTFKILSKQKLAHKTYEARWSANSDV